MIFRFITIIACFLLLTVRIGYANEVGNGVNALVHSAQTELKDLNIGIIVQSLKSGKVLYQYRDNYYFTPASVQKLFTAAAGLTFLGSNFRFKTLLATDAPIQHGVLKGNLYIKFTGDPELKQKQLQDLFRLLHKQGIHKIKGNIFIDTTEYNTIPYPPGWIWDDLTYSYAAPLNAAIINHNKFILHFVPQRAGQRPTLDVDLPKNVVDITNHAITIEKFRKHCPLAIYSNELGHYLVSGCVHKRWGTQHRSLAVRNINAYVRFIIQQALNENQISFSKKIGFHSMPKDANILAAHYSKPLPKILKEMLKDSDNLTTDSIFKKVGEQYYHRQGTWQNSLRALKLILGPATKINFSHTTLSDGAGLSRYNLITPKQLSKLLYYIYNNRKIRKPILNALPIAGKDGTLKSRMLELGKHQRIHAKTGSMTGITALAGFIHSKHNGTLSFVIMINGIVGKREPYISLENDICKFLVNAPRGQYG